jgi:hypothetical protein
VPPKGKWHPLTSANLKILNRHSPKGLSIAAQGLGKFVKNGRWLGLGNAYGLSAAEKLFRDRKAHRAPSAKDLAQYIAASSPLHAADGWSFAARAIEATLRGDCDAARHLAYYAELRAALSLLASQGIGVFNNPHAVVLKSGEAKLFEGGGGTHTAAWLVLRHWMDSASSGEVVADLVTQSGQHLSEWAENLPPGGTPAAVGKKWLATWGIDIRDAVDDRGARNRASYTPTRIYNTRSPAASTARDFVVSWWTSLEPTPFAAFEALDRHLLRSTLEQIFLARTGHTYESKPEEYRDAVSATKGATTGDGTLEDSLGRFLVRDLEPDTLSLLLYSSAHDSTSAPEQHLQVLARATLLLRLATGAASQVLADAGLAEESLQYWIEGVGEDRALWKPGDYPDQLIDLWGDVASALADVRAGDPTSFESYTSMSRTHSGAFAVLAGAERVALWGSVT